LLLAIARESAGTLPCSRDLRSTSGIGSSSLQRPDWRSDARSGSRHHRRGVPISRNRDWLGRAQTARASPSQSLAPGPRRKSHVPSTGGPHANGERRGRVSFHQEPLSADGQCGLDAAQTTPRGLTIADAAGRSCNENQILCRRRDLSAGIAHSFRVSPLPVRRLLQPACSNCRISKPSRCATRSPAVILVSRRDCRKVPSRKILRTAARRPRGGSPICHNRTSRISFESRSGGQP